MDLLLGRDVLRFDDTEQPLGGLGSDPTGCCPAGSAAPCGAQIFVHVRLATALGDSTEPAELVGHGPIDGAELAALLSSAPVLHRVWVDGNGIPVAVDDRTWTPTRADLLPALHAMNTGPPPEQRHPVHPDDHAPRSSPPPPPPPPPLPTPWPPSAPRVLPRPHLPAAGSYRPNDRQRRLLRARAPRCEWPGRGHRASRTIGAGCDLDHDLAWPFGPTYACNLGPLCRRHHRIKQLGWSKQRQPVGSVRWTSPTGQTSTSPTQHAASSRQPGVRRIASGVWAVRSETPT